MKYLFFLFVIGLALSLSGCQHEPFLTGDDPVTPIDTTGNNNPGDTTAAGRPCAPDSVYFDAQILPILRSNCALSGCHDEASAEDGVVLTSYEKVLQTAEIRPGNPRESKLYKVLVDDDPEDRMPKDRPPLPADQIQLISKWIAQGVRDLHCDAAAGGCDTTSVSFAGDLLPVLKTHCQGCHSGGAAPAGVVLTSYAGVKAAVNTGRFYGAVARLPGFTAMPLNGDRLPDCTIRQFRIWIDKGAPEN